MVSATVWNIVGLDWSRFNRLSIHSPVPAASFQAIKTKCDHAGSGCRDSRSHALCRSVLDRDAGFLHFRLYDPLAELHAAHRDRRNLARLILVAAFAPPTAAAGRGQPGTSGETWPGMTFRVPSAD